MENDNEPPLWRFTATFNIESIMAIKVYFKVKAMTMCIAYERDFVCLEDHYTNSEIKGRGPQKGLLIALVNCQK
jgi:hypothetical protein